MEILNLKQGSAEWHSKRAMCRTASEAPAMMGATSKMKRDELLQMKKFGGEKEISWFVQKFLFDKGHEYEAMARPIIEKLINDELYPATVIETIEGIPLLASLDGQTMLEDVIFEHKMWNEALAESVRNEDLSPEYYWQLEHQLMASGAKKVIFTCSDGTEENMVSFWYTPQPGRREQIIKGWHQFEKDLLETTVYEPEKVVIGKVVESLPALIVQVSGNIATTNIDSFRETALAFIGNINTELKTDEDFADAEKIVKFCDQAEKQIKTVKQQSVDSMADVSAVFKAMDFIAEELRNTRLKLDKTVKQEKTNKKSSIVSNGILKFSQHIGKLNDELNDSLLNITDFDAGFHAVVKGKRTITSIESAVNDEIARLKIQSNDAAQTIRVNQKTLTEKAVDHLFLFNDSRGIIKKQNDDFSLLVDSRINKYKADEKEKLECEKSAKEEADRKAKEEAKAITDAAEEKERIRLADIESETNKAKPISDEQVNSYESTGIEPVNDKNPPVNNDIAEAGGIVDAEIEEVVATDKEMLITYADGIINSINMTPPIDDEKLTNLVVRIQVKLKKAVDEIYAKINK